MTHRSSLTVLQGETTAINSSILSTRDDDGLPSQVYYTIVSGSENGFLYLTPDSSSGGKNTDSLLQPVLNFTQEDIDRNRLWFRHRYKFGVKPGIFHFKVNDVNSSPIYSSFTVNVFPVVLTVKTNSPLRLKQGMTQVTVSPENLSLESNLPPGSFTSTQIVYQIVKEPSFGKILLRGRDLSSTDSSSLSSPVTTKSAFSQNDIDSGLIAFVQIDMSSSHDYFEVDMIKASSFSETRIISSSKEAGRTRQETGKRGEQEDEYGEGSTVRIHGIRISIAVDADIARPKKPFLVVGAGQMVFLTLDHVDASELAIRTKSTPIFTIVKKPKYGKLKRLPLSEVLSLRRGNVFFFFIFFSTSCPCPFISEIIYAFTRRARNGRRHMNP